MDLQLTFNECSREVSLLDFRMFLVEHMFEVLDVCPLEPVVLFNVLVTGQALHTPFPQDVRYQQ